MIKGKLTPKFKLFPKFKKNAILKYKKVFFYFFINILTQIYIFIIYKI